LEAKELLKRLSEGTGVSGHETQVTAIIQEMFAPFTDEIRLDKLGNCIMCKRGEGPEPRLKVMIAAHMDEVGLIVTKIEDGGFLRIAVLGIDQRTLPAQEVVVHGRRDLPGVIGIKPPHIADPQDAKKATKTEDLYVDVGLSREEAAREVEVGDLITISRNYLELQGGCAAGKSFDDRAGVVVMFETLRELTKLRHRADVYAVATVQEEVGLRGAITSAYGICPDVAVAIDVCHGDMPGVPESQSCALDKGPAVCLGGNIHPKIHEGMTKTASELGLAHQIEVAPGATGTDAWAIQVSRAGIPCGLLSIPLRYMHTSVEMLAMSDVKKAARLLAHYIASMGEGYMEGLTW
jgi:putative aminopeptidase FrvX